ncbi:MAG TPA: hypothetical protein GX005_09680 [Bacteroidales bacterium]|nr:hypothetical protein [Bacteroidales bacterium]
MNLHKEIEITLGYLEAVKDEDVRYELIHHLEELLSSIRDACNNKEGGTPLTIEELNSEVWFTNDLSVEFSKALQAKGLNVFGDWDFSLYDYVSASFSEGTVTRNLQEEHAFYTKDKKEIYLQGGEFYWVREA